MSILLKQVQCPSCAEQGKDRKGDNLSVYSDGHEWCYSCGYWTGPDGVKRFLSNQEVTVKHTVYLPPDCDVSYPKNALAWVESYELTRNDLLANGVLWSPRLQRLIFPIYGEEALIAWQGRWFGQGNDVKWFGKGNLQATCNILGRSSDTLVLTEDVISAIKVSRFVQAMPIYGSHIGHVRFKRLRQLFGYKHKVVIWLDKDKQWSATKERRTGDIAGLNTGIIITNLDPKEISYEGIKETLQAGRYL